MDLECKSILIFIMFIRYFDLFIVGAHQYFVVDVAIIDLVRRCLDAELTISLLNLKYQKSVFKYFIYEVIIKDRKPFPTKIDEDYQTHLPIFDKSQIHHYFHNNHTITTFGFQFIIVANTKISSQTNHLTFKNTKISSKLQQQSSLFPDSHLTKNFDFEFRFLLLKLEKQVILFYNKMSFKYILLLFLIVNLLAQSCPQNCKTCDAASLCTQCQNGYSISDDKQSCKKNGFMATVLKLAIAIPVSLGVFFGFYICCKPCCPCLNFQLCCCCPSVYQLCNCCAPTPPINPVTPVDLIPLPTSSQINIGPSGQIYNSAVVLPPQLANSYVNNVATTDQFIINSRVGTIPPPQITSTPNIIPPPTSSQIRPQPHSLPIYGSTVAIPQKIKNSNVGTSNQLLIRSNATPPAPQTSIPQALNPVFNSNPDKHTCTICFFRGTNIQLLPCTHQFHENCIIQWCNKKKSRSCPTCNAINFKATVLCRRCFHFNEEVVFCPIGCQRGNHMNCFMKLNESRLICGKCASIEKVGGIKGSVLRPSKQSLMGMQPVGGISGSKIFY